MEEWKYFALTLYKDVDRELDELKDLNGLIESKLSFWEIIHKFLDLIVCNLKLTIYLSNV